MTTPSLTGEVWTPPRSEGAHPDPRSFSQRRLLIGRFFARSPPRNERLRRVHLCGRRGNTLGLECMAGNPPAHHAIDEARRRKPSRLSARGGGASGHRTPLQAVTRHHECPPRPPGMLSLPGAPPEDRRLSLPFLVTIVATPSQQSPPYVDAECSLAVCRSGARPPIPPLPDRRCARRFYRGQHRGVDFRHPPEPGHAPGNRDEAIRLIRLQPHEFEVLAQCLLVLTEAFADLAQTLPCLGGIGPNHRQDPEQPLGRGEVTLRRQQLTEPVQRIGMFRLHLQNPAVADLRIGRLSLAVKFGRLLQQVGNASGVDPAAQIPAVPAFPGRWSGSCAPCNRTNICTARCRAGSRIRQSRARWHGECCRHAGSCPPAVPRRSRRVRSCRTRTSACAAPPVIANAATGRSPCQKVGRYTRPEWKLRVSMAPLERIRLSIRSALRARHFLSQNSEQGLEVPIERLRCWRRLFDIHWMLRPASGDDGSSAAYWC